MITASTQASLLGSLGRLDASYFLAPGAAASRRLARAKAAGLDTVQLGGKGGLGHAWQPSRFKRAYAGRGETSIPYLAPHDAFQYLPDDTERLSLTRTEKLDRYRISRGQILQTCSGRNLGPNVLVDAYLARFATSHDVIRIDIDDERMRHYTVAFLRSRTGQELLRRDKSGSVIDHITIGQVEAQEVPLLDAAVIDRAANLIRESFQLIEEARVTLADGLDAYEAALPSPARPAPAKEGWTVNASALTGRLDAAPYDPWVAQIRRELLEAGGKRVDEVADVLKPPGRYKTIYVSEPFGRAFMSGTQILQLVGAKQQFMAERAFKDVPLYELRQGWSVFMADGRAEKDLGVVAMIPSDREGWLASGHVGRLVPHAQTDAGWLWLGARSWHAQVQIKALASGSVVDSTYSPDMESVILPPDTGVDGPTISDAWEKFARGRHAEAKAIRLVDEASAAINGFKTSTALPISPSPT
ncbi:MAG: hypothetical protein M3065_22835 [Actinomycetota bacterium]|nr:hypothetical protein [Actinomycetota bacterium]